SCWGADNFILPGRWIISLAEIIYRRGAGTVLACLWEIDDVVGAAFTSAFYRQLNTMSRNRALQHVQQLCLKNELLTPGKQLTDHPVDWAGYRLHGVSDRLRF